MVTAVALDGMVMVGMKRIAVGGHDGSLVVELKLAGAGIGDGAVGPLHLKEPGALNGHIERVVGLVQRTLGHDDLGSRRLGAQADLQAGRDRGLALRRARGDQVLVDHVLKLQPQLAKAGGRGVGQVVGDGVQVHLLRAHAAGCCIQGSNHVSFSQGQSQFGRFSPSMRQIHMPLSSLPLSFCDTRADPRSRTC